MGKVLFISRKEPFWTNMCRTIQQRCTLNLSNAKPSYCAQSLRTTAFSRRRRMTGTCFGRVRASSPTFMTIWMSIRKSITSQTAMSLLGRTDCVQTSLRCKRSSEKMYSTSFLTLITFQMSSRTFTAISTYWSKKLRIQVMMRLIKIWTSGL